MTRRNRDDQTEIWRVGYNVERNIIGSVPNVPLASSTGKEIHPLILIMVAIHGGHVKRYIDSEFILMVMPTHYSPFWTRYYQNKSYPSVGMGREHMEKMTTGLWHQQWKIHVILLATIPSLPSPAPFNLVCCSRKISSSYAKFHWGTRTRMVHR